MRENGLVGGVIQVTRRQPGLKRLKAAGDNLMRLQPSPAKQDQVWVANVTYLKVGSKWRNLATMMDSYSRRMLGWSLSRDRSVNLILSALGHTLKHRMP